MFIAVPNEIKEKVIDISPSMWRIQAVLVNTSQSVLLVINSYLCTDNKTQSIDVTDLIETLDVISEILENNEFNDIIWTGDINADFIRKTGHVHKVNDFLQELNFKKSWDKFSIDFTHSCELNDITHTAVIDHFFWNEGLEEHIVEAGVLHISENTSDHCPIYCVVNTSGFINCDSRVVPNKIKPSWKKASKEQKDHFIMSLEDKLLNLSIPDCILKCRDTHCDTKEHIDDIDEYMNDILNALQSATTESLPMNLSLIHI